MRTQELNRAYLKRPTGLTAVSGTHRPLAVLIVTYKSHELVEQCLASVAGQLPGLPVYVYENSGDGYPGREELAARYPNVHWVLGPVNLGFAAAFNALVEHTPRDADLLLLNADQIVQASALIQDLWGTNPPTSAQTTLQTYVLQIRKCLSRLLGAAARDARRRFPRPGR